MEIAFEITDDFGDPFEIRVIENQITVTAHEERPVKPGESTAVFTLEQAKKAHTYFGHAISELQESLAECKDQSD